MISSRPLCFLLIACAAAGAQADDEPAVTPYRPSVSSPAQLPAVGQLEFEFGGQSMKTDGARRDSTPYLFKLAFSEDWGVLVGGEAVVSARDGSGQRDSGVGDTNLVLKRAFTVDKETALGLELGVKLPSAKDSIGSGKADYSLNAILSQDMGSVHMDANVNLLYLGQDDPGASHNQVGLSASFAVPLSEQWGATAELSGTRRSGAASTAQLLLAAAYSPSKRMTIDFGVARGLNAASPDWALFTGFVVPLARLW